MANQELLNYVNQQLVLGTSRDEIKNILLGAGWQKNDINDAISQATIHRSKTLFLFCDLS